MKTLINFKNLISSLQIRSLILQVFLVSSMILFLSCDSDSDEIILEATPPIERSPSLVELLESEYAPLGSKPLEWTNSELNFLDEHAAKQVIGLGEGTHGTAEFFDAKFRIFQYLVENHGHRLFAIEADFGESLFINAAIQNGATDEIVDLMRTKMIFWTWRTEEVRRLIEWMSDYNQDQPEAQKLQYVGIDAQFNIHNIDLLSDYLRETNAPFLSAANGVLREAKNAETTSFANYNEDEFALLMDQLDQVQEAIQENETLLVAESSKLEFDVNLRLAKVIQQVTQVIFAGINNDNSISYRDQYMAENTLWLSELYENEPVVLWAHNAHVAKDPLFGGAGGAIGRQLQLKIGANYESIGFLFAGGTFNARSDLGDQSFNLMEQNITTAPKSNSLNAIMNNAEAAAFRIDLEQLNQYESWGTAYANSMEYFHIGAIYNQNPLDYYRTFNPIFYDQIIFIDQTRASGLIPSN